MVNDAPLTRVRIAKSSPDPFSSQPLGHQAARDARRTDPFSFVHGSRRHMVVVDDGLAAAPTFGKRIAFAVAAVEAAGLVDALKGEGPFTVFAPTDDAFAAIPAIRTTKLFELNSEKVTRSVTSSTSPDFNRLLIYEFFSSVTKVVLLPL